MGFIQILQEKSPIIKKKNGRKKLLEQLKNKKIIEVTNEIDRSAYLTETGEDGEPIVTNLLQQYEMPTVEIVYILN